MTANRDHHPSSKGRTARPRLILAPTLAAAILALALSPAPSEAVRAGRVDASLVTDATALEPGQPFTVALRLVHDPGWHTYWINPGSVGYPPTVEWTLPEGFTAGPLQFPLPHKDVAFGEVFYGYGDETFFLTEITPPDPLPAGPVPIRAVAGWLQCNDEGCVPSDGVELSLQVGAGAPGGASRWAAAFAQTRATFPRDLPGWEASVERTADSITLRLIPGGDATADPGEIYFFSADKQVDANAEQALASDGDAYVLTLKAAPPEDPGAPTPTRLAGILHAAKGWLPGGEAPALRVDVGYPGADADAFGSDPGSAATAPAAAPQAPAAGGSDAGGGGPTAPPLESNIFKVLLFAFLGGLILNLMPCVFPVLGLKVMGFVKQAGEDSRLIKLHGLVFTAGVLVSFWALAGLLLALRAGGEEIGWGFQLQSPGFVLFLIVLLYVFSLNLAGLFEVGTSMVGVGSDLTARSGLSGSFFSGVLATVVATPCAAPFLATAVPAALALSAAAAMAVFTVIALGLASPYLFFSIFPQMVQQLPRPGAWMETFKQAMSFPLFATVAWLVWVFAAQVGDYGLLLVGFALVLLAVAGWVYGRWATPVKAPKVRRAAWAGAAALTLVALGLSWVAMDPPAPEQKLNLEPYSADKVAALKADGQAVFIASLPAGEQAYTYEWQKWSPAVVEILRSQGHPVYVDFTAKWCATCQTNKLAVFASDEVEETFKSRKVVRLKADWTNKDATITEALAQFGRDMVPLNLLYLPGQKDPVILPPLLIPKTVLQHFEGVAAPPLGADKGGGGRRERIRGAAPVLRGAGRPLIHPVAKLKALCHLLRNGSCY